MEFLLQWAVSPEEQCVRRPRRNHSSAFKANEAIAAVKGDKTLAELADSKHPQIHTPHPVEYKEEIESPF